MTVFGSAHTPRYFRLGGPRRLDGNASGNRRFRGDRAEVPACLRTHAFGVATLLRRELEAGSGGDWRRGQPAEGHTCCPILRRPRLLPEAVGDQPRVGFPESRSFVLGEAGDRAECSNTQCFGKGNCRIGFFFTYIDQSNVSHRWSVACESRFSSIMSDMRDI